MIAQTWRYCEGHDVRFTSRSPASLQHVTGHIDREGIRCEVRDDPDPQRPSIAEVLGK